jgi:Predicted membrane protein (DUF2085)
MSLRFGQPMQGVFKPTPLRSLSFFADFLLSGMVVGPIAAPYLAASGWLLLPGISQIIYFMGERVCPQPDLGITLAAPHIMAVCMRCYGTIAGLLMTRILYAITRGRGFYWLHQYGWNGPAIAAMLMLAYPAELAAEVFSGWAYDNYTVTLFGLITGLGWGLITMPVLHGTYPRPNPTQACDNPRRRQVS